MSQPPGSPVTDAVVPNRVVSPTRRAISILLLLVVIATLAIEVRATLGQQFSGNNLRAMLKDDLFVETDLPTVQKAIVLFPAVTTIRDNDIEVVYRYEWQSLLRGIAGKPPSELFLVARKNPPGPVTFYTERQDAESGFWGDPVEAEEPEVLPMPEDDNPRGIQDYVPGTSAETQPDENKP